MKLASSALNPQQSWTMNPMFEPAGTSTLMCTPSGCACTVGVRIVVVPPLVALHPCDRGGRLIAGWIGHRGFGTTAHDREQEKHAHTQRGQG